MNKNDNNETMSSEVGSTSLNKRIILIVIIAIVVTAASYILITNYKNRGLETITLETHANEIYEWEYEIDNTDVVKFYKKQRFGDLKGTTKKGLITEKYIFKALKPGKTTIKFTYKNTNNGSYGEINEYKVVVDKNMKLNIEKKKYE